MSTRSKPNLLYSVNTRLAYNLSITFYRGLHYVWCTPVFSSRNYSTIEATPPPTSCPFDIYHSLAEEVRRGDGHSDKVAQNRKGLVSGARKKHTAGIISVEELAEIIEIAEVAAVSDFMPLLYVIPFSQVSHLLKEVPVSERAHPMSQEYVIEELPTDRFDVLELERY